ncbi:hypothetical protein [Alteribacter populi]|uniref:hypothetical protein n=1 Tax=Alteribacter populi TaxID=2011011 RepID=UPI000BBAC485|nr:hypothetical protein [Alteribacter populi]
MKKRGWIWLVSILLVLIGGVLLWNTVESPTLLYSLPYHLLIIAAMFAVWGVFEWKREKRKLAYVFIGLAVFSLSVFCFTTLVF